MTPEQQAKVDKCIKRFDCEKYPCKIMYHQWPKEPEVVTVAYHNGMWWNKLHVRTDGSSVITNNINFDF